MALVLKVLIVCNDYDYFLRHRLYIARYLVSRGHEVTVITGGRRPEDNRTDVFEVVHCPVERFSFNPVKDAWLFFSLLFAMRRLTSQSLYLITLKPAIYGGLAAILARSLHFGPDRIVITIPGLGRLMSPLSEDRRLRARISRALVNLAVKFIAARPFVSLTFETADDRSLWIDQGLISSARSFVVSGAGVDADVFTPVQAKRADSPLVVLFASRLLKAKGIDAFLRAAEQLTPTGRVRFLLAGMVEDEDPDRYPLEALKGNRAIEFLGAVLDMPTLLQSVDIVCLPTLYGEGIPRILIEAAASGLPAIATNLPGCRDIIIDGQTGMLIGRAEPELMAKSLAAAICHYLDHPATRVEHGQNARAHFLQSGFNEDAIAQVFEELLTSSLPGK